MKIDNLKTFQDGITFIHLTEILSGKSVPLGKYVLLGNIRVWKIENISAAISFLSSEGVDRGHLSPEGLLFDIACRVNF